MRLGISATSAMWPKYLRRRLRPVNESVIERFPAFLKDKKTRLPRWTLVRRGNGDMHQCASAFDSRHASLFQLDFRTSVFELLLDLLGFVLVHIGLDLFRSAFDEVFGFLEAESGDRADFLDHVDLFVASTC